MIFELCVVHEAIKKLIDDVVSFMWT